MNNGSPLMWVVIGVIIIGCIVAGVIMYNWASEGQEYAKSGDIEGLGNWLIGAVVGILIILFVVIIFSKAKG